jgi:hypothetical protein
VKRCAGECRKEKRNGIEVFSFILRGGRVSELERRYGH